MLNFHDTAVGKNDPFPPYLRVTKSFNGNRVLRFAIGFTRKHCSNGFIFEEEIATIRGSHSAEVLAQLKVEIKFRILARIREEFSRFLNRVRSIDMDSAQSTLALNAALRTTKALSPTTNPSGKMAQCSFLRLQLTPDPIPNRTRPQRLRRVDSIAPRAHLALRATCSCLSRSSPHFSAQHPHRHPRPTT